MNLEATAVEDTADLLSRMPRGFADPTHDAQAVFRCVLEALSRPGRLQTIAAADGLQAPAPLSRGLTAVLLTLLDGESSLHLAGPLASDLAWMSTRFHTGVQAAAREDADFVAERAATARWDGLRAGSDAAPQQGATLIVEAPSLAGAALTLTGPGIEHAQRIGLCGLPREFWLRRIEMQREFPRGVDLLLVCGTQLMGVPRSTRVSLNGSR